MVVSTPIGSPLRRYKSVDDFNRVNATLNKLLEKERAERERIDRAALEYLRAVKEDYENQIMTLSETVESLRKESEGVSKKDLQEVKFELRCAQRDIKESKSRLEYLRSAKKESAEKCEELEAKLKEKEAEIEQWKVKCENVSADVKKITDEKTSCEEKCSSLEKEKAELVTINEKLTSTNKVLKETCASVETQVSKFENLFKCQVDVKVKLTEEKAKMLEKITKLEQELESITNKYQSQVMDMSSTITALESSVTDYKTKNCELEKELQEIQDALEEEKQFRVLHEDELPSLLKENELKQKTVDFLQQKLNDYEKEIFYLKEEASEHITSIAQINSQNKQLSLALEEALVRNDVLQKRIDVIVTELEDERNKFQLEQVKFNETANQQLKLIDMLRNQKDKPKKASWFGHHPTNSPAKDSSSLIRVTQIRELEGALERERTKNKTLTQQIDETKQELRRYKNEFRKMDKRGYHLPLQDGKGDVPSNSSSLDPKNTKEVAFEVTPSISSSTPSAPYHIDVDNLTCSSASTSTTDNNDTSEEEKEFTFNESIVSEFNGQRKASSVG